MPNNIIMADVPSGISGSKITQHVTTTNQLYPEITAARIKLVAENEVLIWNIKGQNVQTAGSTAKKMGIVVVQNGAVINNASGNKPANKDAPDEMTPISNWDSHALVHIEDGYYVGNSGNFYCGVGNTIEFIQIPYDMGWNV